MEVSDGVEPTPTPVPPDPTSDRPFASWLPNFVPSEVFRVMPGETPAEQRFAENYIDRFEVIGSAVPIPTVTAKRLITTLLNSPGFGELRRNRCKFRPGISFRGGEGDARVDLLVCFACDEIGIVPAGKSLAAVYAFDQSTRDVLLAAAKELLPKDEAIQELPEVRREGVAPALPVPILRNLPAPILENMPSREE